MSNDKEKLKPITLLIDEELAGKIEKIKKQEKATKAWTYRKLITLGIDSYDRIQESIQRDEKITKIVLNKEIKEILKK